MTLVDYSDRPSSLSEEESEVDTVPVHPRQRDLRATAGGARLEQLLSSSRGITEVLDGISGLSWASSLQRDEPTDPTAPYWLNSWFPALDGLSLAAILKLYNPRLFIEVGSGNSTKFARKAITEHKLQTQIVSIDPSPRAEIDALCDRIIRTPLEDADYPAIFNNLQVRDVVFVDSSHRSIMNSDVTVFFTEILPALAPGVIYGMHDIFLPDDYPQGWSDRYYNEAYLLAMYLLGGAAGDSVLFPGSYVVCSPRYRAHLLAMGQKIGLPDLPELGAGCFWMRRPSKRSRNWIGRVLSRDR